MSNYYKLTNITKTINGVLYTRVECTKTITVTNSYGKFQLRKGFTGAFVQSLSSLQGKCFVGGTAIISADSVIQEGAVVGGWNTVIQNSTIKAGSAVLAETTVVDSVIDAGVILRGKSVVKNSDLSGDLHYMDKTIVDTVLN